ncbi:CELL WALL INVERTASE 1 [Salix viminalis]|uniref:CELL WALL INVERTASE 1 n=1 Tax=Salix viminalis TaxID=40686 RepID=A0A9Q0ZQX1_SALVM|nr:CELL WALL INVERTASE 1 [Salix viminalis]
MRIYLYCIIFLTVLWGDSVFHMNDAGTETTRKHFEALENGCQNFQSHTVMLQEQHSYRTSFHFQPPKNWLNDPNGPMWYKGVYHLFYQYNPYGALFGDVMIWAHSVSHDLINWIPSQSRPLPNGTL